MNGITMIRQLSDLNTGLSSINYFGFDSLKTGEVGKSEKVQYKSLIKQLLVVKVAKRLRLD